MLLWRLTGGKVHATDATNARRTLLFDIHTGAWDEELLQLFGVPRALLPEVVECRASSASPRPHLWARRSRCSAWRATSRRHCWPGLLQPGMVKSTYGTGCFTLMNTGSIADASRNRLLTTIAYQLDGRRTYALEGSIFVAGAAVQWLRDGLGLIEKSADVEAVAACAEAGHGVYMVPAFVGLGAPYWDAGARGALLGLTRDTGPAEIAPPRSIRSAFRRATSSRRCAATARRSTSCASMAAWW